ncbi:probable LRR receptor-like serine/threonine-protein kinase At1g07560 isoform X2 [Cucurbita moschata]|uniref:non-specific serine/threonine protein kinase n=1 Tax=Cucurbita moschata TaxID=3662 RepID=A0A6J1GB78_CUCMO|nr:probable LRR receptor-like serine/threonine-protein kinase At1g07560 isoform X2 [Cucurbita moschata]
MGRSFIHFLLGFLPTFVLLQLGYGQSQQGFISIDCGSNSSYTEPITGLNYVPDSEFINTGIITSLPSSSGLSNVQKQLWNLRSFPQGTRNCYNVPVKVGTKYLIRASFLYDNYDAKNTVPEFDLHFGPNLWVNVKLELPENIIHEEIIHITTSNNAQVCLVNTDKGTPFVSALEFRPLELSSYKTVSGSLATFLRLDIGENKTFTRYPDDDYDRIWSPPTPVAEWVPISTSSPVNNNDNIGFKAPSSVLKTASTVANESAPMIIPWSDPDQSIQFYIYLYFAEFQTSLSRTFKIYHNEKLFYSEDLSPAYLTENVIYSQQPFPISGRHIVNLIRTEDSALPPILNALEIFKVMNFEQPTTDQGDVDAIESIQKFYEVKIEDWQGDPCAPEALAWRALTCEYDDGSKPPRITGLNLSSTELAGKITNNIANLLKLEVLDLSNNNLSGSVPEFLADLPFLRVLNLSGNNLSGQVPAALIDKKNKASFSLSLDGNPNLYVTEPSEKKKSTNILIPILAAVGGVIIILLILASIYYYFFRRRTSSKAPVMMMMKPHSPQNSGFELQPPEPLEQQPSRRYSYVSILEMTNHFETLLGEGGFGKVYYGLIGNTEVAVKILSAKSAQGYREFQSEVDILLRVHHRNLTSLVGYCNEGEEKMGLIYEYMGRGNLGSLLLGGKGQVLRWKDRLQIALDSAQGLEYLHNGCRPPIIHRDIKPSNILLNEHLQAKLADFGLSRAFPIDGDATHVTTKVAGTPGYLDPDYHVSFRLTEKSDVYSFGIVVMELISGRPVILKTSERCHITKWVDFNINQGDIHSIIDPRIKDGCNVNSVWKAVDMAMACTTTDPTNRPTMNQVVSECLNLELNPREDRQVDSITSISSTFDYEHGPSAR